MKIKSWMNVNQFTGITWSKVITVLEFPYFRTKQRKIRVPVARNLFKRRIFQRYL